MSEYEVELYRIIGSMLREIRTIKGLTLEEVADKIDVIPKTLQRYETGERKIKISTIMELADIMGFNHNEFMSEAKQRLVNATYASPDVVHEIVSESNTPYYIINEKTRMIAQEIFEDEDMKLLFDLKKSTQSDRLMEYARFLKEKYERENNL